MMRSGCSASECSEDSTGLPITGLSRTIIIIIRYTAWFWSRT
ncbi:hypothetical protein LINGRAHAP2_LOCUS14587 [Linum grandiflorum]